VADFVTQHLSGLILRAGFVIFTLSVLELVS